MTQYSVKQLADLARVSVRTLHHYDQIDLLKPSFRSEKGYRFYERKQLLLLQQILFYRELGFSLVDIGSVINDPSFDLAKALESHREKIKGQMTDLRRLLKTIDNTLSEINNKQMMKDSEIYAGFTVDEAKSIRQEVSDRWGEQQLKETEERIRSIGKEGWEDTKQKGEEINQLLADLMDLEAESTQVQNAIDMHFRHMNLFYEVSKERYQGLAKLYVEDQRFKDYYEKYRIGFSGFMKQAMEVYCEKRL